MLIPLFSIVLSTLFNSNLYYLFYGFNASTLLLDLICSFHFWTLLSPWCLINRSHDFLVQVAHWTATTVGKKLRSFYLMFDSVAWPNTN